MSLSWFVTNVIAAFLLPPLNLMLLLLAGILLVKHSKPAKALLIAGCSLLWLCATPYCAQTALQWLESSTEPLTKPLPPADAIVILGGGTYFNAPEYAHHDTVKRHRPSTAALRRQITKSKPIAHFSDRGKPVGNAVSEAEQMQEVLTQDFQVPVRWQEQESTTTFENAQFSRQMLQPLGVNKIYLVTHAMHMRRAADIFRRAGFQVLEAPTAFTTRYQMDLLTFIPDAKAIHNSKLFFHELIGILWYKIKS